MQKKRLIHIISSLRRGGAESLLVDLIKNLNEFEHFVVFFHDGPNRLRLEELGVSTYWIKGVVCLYDPVFWVRLYVLIFQMQPDIIHSALWAANLAGRVMSKLFGIPLVSVIHLGDHEQDGKLRNIIDSVTYRFSGAIVAVSQEIAQTLRNRNWVPAHKIRVILNGIDIESVQGYALNNIISRKKLGLLPHYFVVGAVGRFHPRKNFQLLIRAFVHLAEQHEHIRLVLVGFGPQEQELRSLIADLGIDDKVIFIVDQLAYGYYPLFDCFVQSSFQEGISIALLEAMSFSLPCLITNPTKLHEVVIDGSNGLIVPSNNLQVLTEKLGLLIENQDMGDQLGKNAQQTIVDQFCIKKMVTQYKKLFHENGNT